MAISNTTPRIVYDTDGEITEFDFSFPILDSSDLEVYYRGPADPGDVLLTLNSDYTVSAGPWTNGGTVTVSRNTHDGGVLTILRSRDYSQQTEFAEGGKFPAKSIEDALDSITMMVQQVRELYNRTIKIPVSETGALELPITSQRQSKVLGFDSSGNLVATNNIVWHTGSGAPDNFLTPGNNDDFYLDEDTGDVYQKTSGSWVFVMSIKGPKGDSGDFSGPNLIIQGYLGFQQEYDNGNGAGFVDIDWNNGNIQKLTLTGDVTINFTPIDGVGQFVLRLVQDSSGGHQVEFGALVLTPGGDPVINVTSANTETILHIFYNGEAYYVLANEAWSAPGSIDLVLGPEDPRKNDTTDTPTQPVKGATYTDQHYGTTVRRATDYTDFTDAELAKTTYSRRNIFNADNSMAIVEIFDSATFSTTLALIDPNDGTVIQHPLRVGPPAALRTYHRLEHMFHYTEPTIAMALGTDPMASVRNDADKLKVVSLDMTNIDANGFPARTTMFDLANTTFHPATNHPSETNLNDIYGNANIHHMWVGMGEGWPSQVVCESGTWAGYPRYWAFQVENEAHPASICHCAVVYDLQQDMVLGLLDMQTAFGNTTPPNHTALSRSGEYVYIAGRLYDKHFQSYWQPSGLSDPHADWAVDASGRDCYVWVDFSTGAVKASFPDTETTIVLFNWDQYGAWECDFHISGLGWNKPGWVVMSPYTYGTEPTLWYSNKILLQEIKENGRCYILAHQNSRSDGANDETAPHACANHALTRIAWSSNWQFIAPGTLGSDVYVLEIPFNSIPNADPA